MRAQKLSEDYVVSGMAARCLMYHGALPETETNIFLIAYYLAHPIASCIQYVDLGIDSTAERFRKRMNNVFS